MLKVQTIESVMVGAKYVPSGTDVEIDHIIFDGTILYRCRILHDNCAIVLKESELAMMISRSDLFKVKIGV